MNYSLYSAMTGAQTQQRRMDVIANNLSNLNTTGFKSRQGTFSELIYENMNAAEGEDTRLLRGAGARMIKADSDFSQGVVVPTGSDFDYAIDGDGFFALYDPLTQEISYTRNGHFSLSEQPDGRMMLVSDTGKWVLNSQGQPNVMEGYQSEYDIGVFIFEQKNGMLNIGQSEFLPVEKNGQPIVSQDKDGLLQGYLENSNVDFEREIVHMIESQRVYQMNLQMVQTTDEITNTINGLRQ